MRGIRFEPDPNALVEIFLGGKDKLLGLMLNESYQGFSAVTRIHDKLVVGSFYQVKPGELKKIPAKLCWIRPLDNEVYRLGFEYKEIRKK